MAYGDPNQPDGSFKGPGKGLPLGGFELPEFLLRARRENTEVLREIRQSGIVKSVVKPLDEEADFDGSAEGI